MAKAKNKKDKNSRKKVQSKLPPAPAESTKTAKNPVSENKIAEKRPISEKPKNIEHGHFVRLSTCISGMFLTLCLGLYLGSLIPDLLAIATKPVVVQHAEINAKPVIPTQQGSPQSSQALPQQQEDKSLSGKISPKMAEHIRHLQEDLKNNPDNSALLADLGNAYFDTGQVQKAISAYERSLVLVPKNPDVLTDLGIMYREARNYDKALECFKKAIEINPEHLNALFNQGVVLGLDQQKNVEAKAVWQRLIELSPDARAPDGRKVSELINQLDRTSQN